jgi:signal peptide peptidase SppA
MNKLTTFKEKIKLEKVSTFIKRVAPLLKWILIISSSIVIGGYILGSYFYNESSPGDTPTTESGNCNVQGINLHGTIVTYNSNDSYDDQGNLMYDQTSSEDVAWYIKNANNNPDIKAIVIEVDSGGGSPVGGEEISNAVKNSKKPVVAFIRDIGASAAYLGISSADRVFASVNSNVGSIGVTQSYLSNVGKNQKEGVAYIELTSGKYKDTGAPDKVLTYDEKTLLLRDINIMFENFVKAVAQNRGLTIKAVKSFADGSTVMGERAKELGMIDEIGGINEVEKYLEGVINDKVESLINDKVEVCWQ